MKTANSFTMGITKILPPCWRISHKLQAILWLAAIFAFFLSLPAQAALTMIDINPMIRYGEGQSGYPYNLVIFNGKLYFSASGSERNNELWVSDGTASGTTLLKDIRTT